MADREKILRYFKAGGDEQLAAKLLDLAEGANKSRKFRVSEFLDLMPITLRKSLRRTTKMCVWKATAASVMPKG